jgi:transcriptional repressor NrdR
MECPFCSHADTKVTDKRDVDSITRRRRECLKCAKRFTTHERVEWSGIMIQKKDGRKEAFNRTKVLAGISKACEKRPVTPEVMERMVHRIEDTLRKRTGLITSSFIGELVSRELKKVDKVAYIRFASVYRDFADISDFKKEIKQLVTT